MPAPAGGSSPDVTRQMLRTTRRLRAAAFFGLGAPIVITAAIVAINKLTSGGLRFFVNGAPWTRTFWSGLFYLLLAGVVLSLLTVSRVCPRCGNGLFSRKGYRRGGRGTLGETGAQFNVNIFGRCCINCGLAIDGSDSH
jgi:hypothetical protein